MRWFDPLPPGRWRAADVAHDDARSDASSSNQPVATRHRLRSRWIVAATVISIVPAATGCDTGDGKQLKPPQFPLPSTTAAQAGDELDEAAGDGGLDPVTVPVDDAEIEAGTEFGLVASWPEGGPIDPRHTCDGVDVSPALQWQAVPEAAVELALVVRDEDADGFLHWIVTGVDPALSTVIENSSPAGATEWPNSFGDRGWAGPCPPPGATHLYQFEILALNQPTELADTTPASDVIADLEPRTIASTAITGTFTR